MDKEQLYALLWQIKMSGWCPLCFNGNGQPCRSHCKLGKTLNYTWDPGQPIIPGWGELVRRAIDDARPVDAPRNP